MLKSGAQTKIHDNHAEQKAEVLVKLQDLLAQPSDRQVRPCPDCRIRFGQQSILSAENCSSKCKYAPRHMSSEPDQYPIEAGIVPLVYALYSMRVTTPCWSCEGHLDNSAKIEKFPKVWFYSASDFYPKLMAQVINEFQGQHKISDGWGVSVLPFSQSMYSTTYAIEPHRTSVGLQQLQADIRVLGKDLRQRMLALARDYVRRGNRN